MNRVFVDAGDLGEAMSANRNLRALPNSFLSKSLLLKALSTSTTISFRDCEMLKLILINYKGDAIPTVTFLQV